MKTRTSLAALVLMVPAFAEEKPATPTPPPETAIVAATDLAALKELMGKSALVEGTIAAQGENNAGTMRYLNFAKKYKEALTLVFVVSKGGEEFSKEKLAPFVGKKVRVTGVISTYNDALQIKIDKLDQIQIQAEPTPAPQP
jgi:hypothetical protein